MSEHKHSRAGGRRLRTSRAGSRRPPSRPADTEFDARPGHGQLGRAQPRPGHRPADPDRRRRRHRRRPVRQRRQHADDPAARVGHRRRQHRHDVRHHRRRHRPVGRRDRRAGLGLGDDAGDPDDGRGHALDRHGVRRARGRRRLRPGQRRCSSPTAGSRRSSRRWRCWPPPAAWPRSSPSARRRSSATATSSTSSAAASSASRSSSSSSRCRASVGWVLLNRTTFGRRTLAVGGNAEAARLAGIDVRRHTALLYVLLGVACGIAAVMLIARTTTGSSTHGSSTSSTRSPRSSSAARCSAAAAAPSSAPCSAS